MPVQDLDMRLQRALNLDDYETAETIRGKIAEARQLPSPKKRAPRGSVLIPPQRSHRRQPAALVPPAMRKV